MKKQIIAGMAAAMVCVGAVGGTFAYLTQTTGEVRNTFTVGNNVQISLDETDVDELGVAVPEAGKVTANEYKLIPGHEYTKDPTVHVDADSETCYVFIKVDNGIAAIESDAEGYVNIAEQIARNGWTALPNKSGYYYKTDAVSPEGADVDIDVFGQFAINKDAYIDAEKAPMDPLNLAQYTDATITITACAVQADGFDSALEASVALPEDF